VRRRRIIAILNGEPPMPTPSFDKSPPQLVARFDELSALVPDATRRPMFGYPSCVLRGHMFMSLFGDRLILRLGEEDRRDFLARHKTGLFEPMPGRPMKEYVVVPPSLASERVVEDWIARAHTYADSLPAKPLKSPRGRKRAKP
jgi:TfoX N-terminal domain